MGKRPEARKGRKLCDGAQATDTGWVVQQEMKHSAPTTKTKRPNSRPSVFKSF